MDLIEELLASKNDLDTFANKIPCLLHINSTDDFRVLYLDPKLRDFFQNNYPDEEYERLKITLEAVHPDDLEKAKKSCRHYLDHIDEFSTVSFLQRIKFINHDGYSTLYTTSILIEELGGLVSFSVLLDDISINNKNIDTIVNETNYIKENFNKLNGLTQKEIVLVKLWVKNTPNQEIGNVLQITLNTVKTYKKRVYKKLGINNFKSLHDFAKAFEIV